MIKCTVCGYENKEDAQYCLNCGSPITREKVSHALDDVSEEQTVMLDPNAMQKRIQEEMEKEKAQSSGQVPKPEVKLPPPATQPAPQPATHSITPPAASPTPSSGPMTDGPGGGTRVGVSDKQWLIAFLLAFFFGYLGAHRFYVGKLGTGALMLVTLGGCGIWVIVDLILIIIGNFRDAEGQELAK